MKWNKANETLPDIFEEVLIIVDGKRDGLWSNKYPPVAYFNGDFWAQERNPDDRPIEPSQVLYWIHIIKP